MAVLSVSDPTIV